MRVLDPGNHDRYLHTDPEARDLVAEKLGAVRNQDGSFSTMFESRLYKKRSPDYGVVAFHGHEVDMMNFGGVEHQQKEPEFTINDYGEVTMGEVITVEIASRLPRDAGIALAGNLRSKREIERVKRILLDMDNVRPMEAVFPWLEYVMRDISPNPRKTIDKVICNVFDKVAEWEYVKKWSDEIGNKYIPGGDVKRFFGSLLYGTNCFLCSINISNASPNFWTSSISIFTFVYPV